MKLIRTLLLAGIAAGALGSTLNAADFYVQAVKPGAVAGAPLAAISLQATLGGDTSGGGSVQNLNDLGNTAGKWVAVGDTQTTTAPPAPTSTTTAPPTATSTTATSTATSTTAITATSSTLPPLTNVAQPTAAQTFTGLVSLLQSGKVKGGDRIFLLGGAHGAVLMKGVKFSSPVTIAAMPGQTVQLDELQIYDSSNMVFRDLKVWSSNPASGTVALVRTVGNSSDITFANLDVRSVADAPNYLNWSLATWTANKRGGFLLDGQRIKAIGNRVTGTKNALLADADYALLEGNIIDGFAGDGMRANGDNSLVRGNKVQNCFQIDGSHIDGIQSFSMGPGGPGTGTVYNLTIENNKFLEWTLPTSATLRCKMQGISMFDGMYDGTIIRNNLVASSQYHGITIAGSRNGLITQNTVVHINGTPGRWPWISVASHKNGTPPTNTLVVNNIANRVKGAFDPARNVREQSNIVPTNYATEFKAPMQRDFSLLPTAKAANKADPAYSTPTDIAGTARPKGSGPDAGAYESQ